jgi:hypothetical protein
MKPILWFGMVADLTFCTVNLIAAPVACLSHGRWLAINNGHLQITDPHLNGVVMSVVGAMTIICWLAIPTQFSYRYYLVK